MYRLKAKLENAQQEQDSLRQELDRIQGGVQRIHTDRDKVEIWLTLKPQYTYTL